MRARVRWPRSWLNGWVSASWTPVPCIGRWPGPPPARAWPGTTSRRWPRLPRACSWRSTRSACCSTARISRGAIRSQEVTDNTHFVADNPLVREHLVALQRRLAQGLDVVTEGRDQGTVAFPEAQCKFFLTASAHERARRRLEQLRARGEDASLERSAGPTKSTRCAGCVPRMRPAQAGSGCHHRRYRRTDAARKLSTNWNDWCANGGLPT